MTKAPRISVIIRTRNEEAWVDHCLNMVFRQDYPDFEVIVVDNGSTDHTLEIVRRYPVAQVVTIDRYKPGLALNLGIRASSGALIACLSSHCIPQRTDWLSTMARGFDDPAIAGVYGRQLPLVFSREHDKRDLITTFGQDRRVQIKDYFFHNANSVLRRDVWDQFPFDEDVTNIEDRIWGKQVISAGWHLLYEPEAGVYHHHGINQDGDQTRLSGVSSILDTLEADLVADLPELLRPENSNVVVVVPVLGDLRTLQGGDLFGETMRQLARAGTVSKVYALAENESVGDRAEALGAGFIQRPKSLASRDVPLGEVLQYALEKIEAGGDFPQTILYVNYLSPFRPSGLFDALTTELHYKGLDTVFPGYVDYNDHWVCPHAGQFERVTESHRPAPDRPRLYRSLYSLGVATRASVVRKGQLVGDKVGILPITDHLYTLRCTDERPEPRDIDVEDTQLIGWTARLFLKEFRP